MVIGNSSYRSLPSLQNPANDAEGMAVALDALDFEVLRGIDLGRQEMLDLIDRFAVEIRDADVALFFYAGHGFQVSSANFLVPSDADLAAPQDVADETIPLNLVMAALEASPGLRLVFLDACRDNPLGGEMPGGREDGLAIVERLKSEDHYYKILWVFKRKCTKWELVLSFRDWFTKISAMRYLGFVDGEFAKEVEYMNKKGYYAYRGVRELTNNGTRDAYLNPEQASFVNRWGK
jgi:hypothetical protein